MCVIIEPEDLLHFLCSCTLYISLRKTRFNEAIKSNAAFQSFSHTNTGATIQSPGGGASIF